MTQPQDIVEPSGGLGLAQAIAREGFAFIQGREMHERLLRHGALDDWQAFAESWNDLARDRYLVDGARFRERRFAIFSAERDGAIAREPHGPHYQSRDYNRVYGGIERWFEPLTAQAGDSRSLATVLETCRALFGALAPQVPRWHIEVHQFRILARAGEPGQPTPEGLHRDGVDYVLVLMIRRENIASGTTSIHALDGRELGRFTLAQPFDAALVEDARVYHGVTAVEPVDPSRPAFRDVLVVTFRAAAPPPAR